MKNAVTGCRLQVYAITRVVWKSMNQNNLASVLDFSQILIAAKSPVNRVVLAKIAERAGLKPMVETPDSAIRALRSTIPGVVILDGGVDNKECDDLVPAIAAARRSLGKALPAVILLSTHAGMPECPTLSAIVDAVVAKPVTPEKLQPVIERMAALARA
ncbi:response regulator [Mesorhizobium sp. A556]